MAKNLWQKERSGLVRDLIREYVDEGYAYKEAKKLAPVDAPSVIISIVPLSSTLFAAVGSAESTVPAAEPE